MIDRIASENVFRAAVEACLPERFIKHYLQRVPARARFVYGLAIGNAAVSMLRGAGPVMHGIAITRDDDRHRIPKGWAIQTPDASAATAILDLVATASPDDILIVLLSAGAETILPADLRQGGLARIAACPLYTLIASDRRDDKPEELAGAPTLPERQQDRSHVIVPYGMFAAAFQMALRDYATQAHILSPMMGSAAQIARQLVGELNARNYPLLYFQAAGSAPAPQARLLAIELASVIAGTNRRAFVAASSGWDNGPAHPGRPRPAGAFVDGQSWAKLDQLDDKLVALDGIGASVITQLTGIDYGGDIVMIG
ncbi:MAG: DUF4147 domain-containing protein [Kofleriaceae bacterium]